MRKCLVAIVPSPRKCSPEQRTRKPSRHEQRNRFYRAIANGAAKAPSRRTHASVLTPTIVSVIPGPAQQEPGILSPSPLDSGFAPSGAPRNDESTKCQKHNTSGASEETAFARLWPLSCRSRCDKGHRVDRSSTRLQLDHFSEDAVAFGQFDQESPNLRSIRNF